MSGIEAVGIILAIWPIVVNLADAYKAGKDGSSLKNLKMNIMVQEKIFKQSIQKLLQGDEKLSDKDKNGLIRSDTNFAAIWTDPEFISRLEKRLDDETFHILKFKAQEISRILTILRKKIEPKEGESVDDKGQEKKPSKRKAVVLAIQAPEVKKHLVELKDHIGGLRTILEASSTTVYSAEQKTSRPTHQRTTSETQRKQYFDDFYEALSQSFHCQCGRPHEASLRISDTLELVFPEGETGRTMSSELHVRARSITLDSQITATIHTEMEEYDDTSEVFRSTWSRSGKQPVSSAPSEHRALSVMFTESRGVRNLSQISDLCQWVRTLRASPPNSPAADSQGLLGRDGKRYTVAPRAHDTLSTPTVMSMDDCLSSTDGGGLTRRTRIDLALNLTSAIERFHPTSWIDIAWTWRNFSMMREDNKHRLCITRRFWSLDAPRQSATGPPTSKFWRTMRHKDPMLVKLGFALIELAMGHRLSDIRSRIRGEADSKESDNEWMKDLEDWNTANDLVDSNMIQDEISPTYQQIVATCLRCEILQDNGLKPLRRDSVNFGGQLDKFVVEPLRQYYANTWGQVGQMASF